MLIKMILTFFFLSFLTFNAFSEVKVVYGDDDRLDIFETTDRLHVDLATSTAAMINKRNLKLNTRTNLISISTRTLESRGICKSERFSDQGTAAMCSGFLVGPDLLVTAGHCIKSASDCARYSWVFDYGLKARNSEKVNIHVSPSSVYECKEIIQRSQDYRTKDDFALLRLKKVVMNRTPLEFRKTGKVTTGADLVVIGHPTGLPTKISAGAIVRDNTPGTYFVSNLDTYGGNSGSAVFDSKTGLVEGILVRGERDYVNRGSCQVSNHCTDKGCRGEDVTRITNITALINL